MPPEYRSFVPDAEAEARVRATFLRLRERLRAMPLEELTPELEAACEAGDPRAVLRHARALVRRSDVLVAACASDCVAIFRLRVALGLRHDLNRWMPRAGRHGARAVLRYLAERGVSPNVQGGDAECRGALHWAAFQDDLPTLYTLLAMPSVDLDVVDAWGDNPLEHAIRHERWAAARALAGAGARARSGSLVHAILKRGPVDVLIGACRGLDAPDEMTGLAPLHAAVACKDIASAQRLLAAGASVGVPAPRAIRVFETTVPAGATPLALMRRTATEGYFTSWIGPRTKKSSQTRMKAVG